MPKVNKLGTAATVQTAPAPSQTAIATAKAATPTPAIKPKTITSTAGRPLPATPPAPTLGQSAAKAEQEITLKYVSPTAKEVKIAGNFNGWHPNTTPLKNNGQGEWTVHLALRTGHYEYRFVVDGHWVEDPRATHRGPNPYGGFNSILTVPPTART